MIAVAVAKGGSVEIAVYLVAPAVPGATPSCQQMSPRSLLRHVRCFHGRNGDEQTIRRIYLMFLAALGPIKYSRNLTHSQICCFVAVIFGMTRCELSY